MKYDIIIAGGGAGGLFAAVCLAEKFRENNMRDKKILIIEKKDKLAKKIYATGNGKCNYTNAVQNKNCYRSENPDFAFNIYKQFDYKSVIDKFMDLGIYPKEKNGYYYPNSEQAASVALALINEAERLGAGINTDEKITKITKAEGSEKSGKNTEFTVTTQKAVYKCDRLLMCMGGNASSVYGTSGDGYYMLKQLSHNIIKPLPALCQLKAEGIDFKQLSGVRCEAFGRIMYTDNSQNVITVSEEYGEYLFAAYGISGIPVFQMSRFAVKLIDMGFRVKMSLDFFKDISENDIYVQLKRRFTKNAEFGGTNIMALNGLLNSKLSEAVLKYANLKPEGRAAETDDKNLITLADAVKNFCFDIIGSNGFENAQVTQGGVDTAQLDNITLESKLVKGLYFAGEIIDVDGTCGGYNLQWAWSSAYAAAEGIFKSYKNIT